ncbi:MAG: flagellar hook capping FlgD N-terminal domain-containing protein [bacterium]
MLLTDTITNALNQTQSQRSGPPKNELDKDAFLKLLTAQLQHQDPLNPTDQKDFVQQVATFSNLEQQISTNQNMSRLLEFQAVAQAASLIDRDVTGLVDGEVVSGRVSEVIFVQGEPVLSLTNGKELPQSALISVGKAYAPPSEDGTDPPVDPPADPPVDPPAET